MTWEWFSFVLDLFYDALALIVYIKIAGFIEC